MDTKIAQLKQLPLFAGYSRKQLAEVASVADQIDVPASYPLIRQGAAGHEFVVLAEGSAVVERDGEQIATIGDGDFVGELALLNDTKRTASVRTTAPSRLFVLAERDFRRLVGHIPAFAQRVMASAAARA